MSKLAWKEIDWTLVQIRLSRQQRRVYKASMEGKRHVVHAIQRRIIRSLDAKLLSVKCVTIENRGKNIVGIDREKVLSHKNKIELAYGLSISENLNNIRKNYLTRTKTKKKKF